MVAQIDEHRAGGGEEAVFSRGRSQFAEAWAEDETSLHVASDEAVVFESHS